MSNIKLFQSQEIRSQLSDKIGQLKMPSADGKSYLTDVANTETLLRLVQSIPSPTAEPFKLCQAKMGYDRLGYRYVWS